MKKFDGALQTGELNKGEKVRGKLAFFVKATAGVTLTYSPTSLPNPISIKLTK